MTALPGLALALWAAAGLSAAEPPGEPLKRRVIALYRAAQISGEVKDPFFLPLHQRAELPLNHLGLDVEYLEASGPLPDPAGLDALGIVAWLPSGASFEKPGAICRWLERAMESGLKVVLLGHLGVYFNGKPPTKLPAECRAALRTLGVEGLGYRNVDPLSVSVASASAMLGFERRPDPSERGVVPLVRVLPGGSAQLRLKFSEGEPEVSEPVAVTPRGGVALDPFFLYANEEADPARYYWVTDPFRFFEEAFGVQGWPRPDVTTLNGRRVYFSRVDGDGIFNLSELDRKKSSGEIFLKEILEKNPDSPFTVSLIAGYYDLQLYNDESARDLARRSLHRPNVEPASHGYAHPLSWRTGKLALSIPRYRMDAVLEIAGSSKRLADRFLPAGRSIELFLWTGDGLPSEEQLRIARDAGLHQMNGGGGRMDSRYDSYAHLFPLGRRVGRERQVYAAVSNENDFTNLWSGPFYGYRDVIQTFERTGSPRRVKPVDVYVHFYSAEKFAALESLRRVYAWARAQPLIPVFSGRYAASVRAFFELEVRRAGPRRFALRGAPALRTVRFDREPGVPDLVESKGVIGWKRDGESLYVSLDGSAQRLVALASKERPGVRLEEANFEVESWRVVGGGVRFSRRGWWTGECVLAGLAPGRRYRVKSGGFDEVLAAGPDGRLAIRFPDAERGRPATSVEVDPA